MSPSPDLVPETLREYGTATRRAMGRFLPSREPRRYLYDLLGDYPARGGAMLRPSLMIATARAFGGRLEDAVGSAAAVELLHNALLIHDDIEDGSEERRGRPTLHVQHGVPLALNVGDALTLASLEPLIENTSVLGPRLALRVLEETERMAEQSAEGQAIELGWILDNVLDVGPDDYLEMVLKKTCWYTTIYPGRVGALIGTRDEVELEPFIRFGFFLGAAFQIQDDVLNLIGDPERYGKEMDGDLWEGKRTLMLIHVWQGSGEEDRSRLRHFMSLSREAKNASEVRWLRRRMDALGSIDYARQIAHGLAGAALHELACLTEGLPESRDRQFLEGLVTWVFDRR